MTTDWIELYSGAAGLLPLILRPSDERPAKEQIAERYAHGGGYSEVPGFQLKRDGSSWLRMELKYPGDPKLKPVASAKLNGELLVLFESSFLAIIKGDKFSVCRVD